MSKLLNLLQIIMVKLEMLVDLIKTATVTNTTTQIKIYARKLDNK